MDKEGSQPQSAVKRIMKEDKTHKNSVRLVLLALAGCIDDGNKCPSIADLADLAQVTEASVRHALAELAADNTISIDKQAGRSKKGGRTNCYIISGYSRPAPVVDPSKDLPPKVYQGTKDLPPNLLQGDEIPQGENLDPTHSQTPGTVEYARARAAGVRDSFALKEQKELKEFDTQTDSLMVIDTRATLPVSRFEDILKTASPEAIAQFPYLLAKAQPVPEQQSAPNPGSGEPLPRELEAVYAARRRPMPEGKERMAMDTLIKLHGIAGAAAMIRDCPVEDGFGSEIKNPAAWVYKTGGETAPKKPAWNLKPIAPAPAPDYSIPPGRSAFDDLLGAAVDKWLEGQHGQT